MGILPMNYYTVAQRHRDFAFCLRGAPVFTGLIETVQPLIANEPAPTGRRLRIHLAHLADDARPGDSIAVNGACLTITSLHQADATFDVMPETLRTTTLQNLKPKQRLNLERALPATGRFAGHIVQGHVDAVAPIKRIDKTASEHRLTVTLPDELAQLVVAKGSIAIDGVSLTVAQLTGRDCTVALIPTTLAETNLSDRRPGHFVNIETDLIARYIKKQLENTLTPNTKTGLSLDKLNQKGFL